MTFMFSLFWDPSIDLIPCINRQHISIDWCIESCIKANWIDQWYMMFEEDPYNNRHMPLYLLKKLYVPSLSWINMSTILIFYSSRGLDEGYPKIEIMLGLIQTIYVTLFSPEPFLIYILLHPTCLKTHIVYCCTIDIDIGLPWHIYWEPCNWGHYI